jgi:lipopolysaccharide export system protein LptA
MKFLWTIPLLIGVAVVLNAQTNLPLPEANLPLGNSGSTNEPAPARALTDVVIESDTWQGNLKSNIFVYRGNVSVTDEPRLKMTCDVFTVEAPKMPKGKFNRGTAEGNVVIDFINNAMTNHATSDKVVYTYSATEVATNNLVELIGKPVITNLSGSIMGDPSIVWDRMSGIVTGQHLQTRIRPNGTNAPSLFGPVGGSKTNSPK